MATRTSDTASEQLSDYFTAADDGISEDELYNELESVLSTETVEWIISRLVELSVIERYPLGGDGEKYTELSVISGYQWRDVIPYILLFVGEADYPEDDPMVEDLSESERHTLREVILNGSISQSSVWKNLGFSSRTATRVGRSLNEKGFIDRKQASVDGSKTYLLELPGDGFVSKSENQREEETDSQLEHDADNGSSGCLSDGQRELLLSESSEKFDLSPTTMDALDLIYREGDVYQSNLWKQLDIASRTGSRVSRTLADVGLIEREEDSVKSTQTYYLQAKPIGELKSVLGGSLDFGTMSRSSEGNSESEGKQDIEPSNNSGDVLESGEGEEDIGSEIESVDETIISELSRVKRRAIRLIESGEVETQVDLWKSLGISSRKGSQIVNELLEDGLISREEAVVNGVNTYRLFLIDEETTNETTHGGNELEQVVKELSDNERKGLELVASGKVNSQKQLWKELNISSHSGSRIASKLADLCLISRSEDTVDGVNTYALSVRDEAKEIVEERNSGEDKELSNKKRDRDGESGSMDSESEADNNGLAQTESATGTNSSSNEDPVESVLDRIGPALDPEEVRPVVNRFHEEDEIGKHDILEVAKSLHGVPQSDLWKVLGISNRNLSRLVTELEEEGAIERNEIVYSANNTYMVLPASKHLDFSLLIAGEQLSPFVGASEPEGIDSTSEEFTSFLFGLVDH